STRLRREPPLGGSLWHKNILRLSFICFLRIGGAFIEPRDYRVVFVLQPKNPEQKSAPDSDFTPYRPP
ncbi:MAG: hypothetical protein IJW44_04580, partial [Clostridia bacterium]|nr:hypothetical protein [Clostridia bacterium]